ncbi:MAG: hypothetical protein HKN32_07515, partial [Flavobacteriales bacterium]|nr:hypothetical protein [Flavobacteriales bacterium]
MRFLLILTACLVFQATEAQNLDWLMSNTTGKPTWANAVAVDEINDCVYVAGLLDDHGAFDVYNDADASGKGGLD